MVEDSASDAILVLKELKRTGRPIESERVEDAAAMRMALTTRVWDIVISDWSMPNFSALGALKVLKELDLDLPFIVASGTIGEEAAVELMRQGAHDYVLKDKLARLAPAVERELREFESRAARRRAEDELRASEARYRKSEDQLRQAQKMEAVGRLAGGVAHDFNNVLSVILSYVDFISADLAPNDPVHADLAEIRKAGQRAEGLTRQLLMFSRQQVTEPKVLAVADLLGGMEKMLPRLLGEDVDLVWGRHPATGRIRADPGQIEQVVMNLVVNARDAMSMGGKLTIECANIELGEDYANDHLGTKAGPHVMIAITDTGTGMDRATQARIFEPFFTTKGVGKGTGLGLSTVFGIVQQAGGSIWVYSEPDIGTTFKVYFPRVDAEVDARHQRPAPAAVRGTETILLVEDEDQVRAVARGILRRHGYQVLEAQNAGEALLITETAGHIDLLLSDVVMPQMSGPELARRMAALRPGMKILCMSGYTDDSIVRHGVLDGGISYLQKPITSENLTRKVREVLDAPGPAKEGA